jgi:ribonucleoside-diphosphate reductase alpha chain
MNNQMRRKLPNTRPSVTHTANIGGTKFFITASCFPDGQPAEIFTKTQDGNRHGLQGWTDSLCKLISLALQCSDLGPGKVYQHLVGQDFPPQGPTGDPAIGIAKSFPDYLARYIKILCEQAEQKQQTEKAV